MAKRIQRTPTKTRAQRVRNFHILYVLMFPIFNLIMYPVRALHRERIPEGPCLFCPNHTSMADPPMVCFAAGWKHPMRIMAKQELLDTPVLGWVLNKIGTFGVDRGNSDLAAIKTGLKTLKEGEKLLLFPEGGRVAEGADSTAKTGAIMLAMKTGVPIVPVFSTPKKRMFHRSTLVFGEPYTVKPAGRRATPQEYEEQADILLKKIYALEAELS